MPVSLELLRHIALDLKCLQHDEDAETISEAVAEIERLRKAAVGADVGAEDPIRAAATAYLMALDAKPEQDCWDTETGEEEPGAQRFASDWAISDHWDAVLKARKQLRDAVGADVRAGDDQTKAPA